MEILNKVIGVLLERYVSLFGFARPLLSLIPVSVLAGAGLLWVFRKTSNPVSILSTKKRLQAHLLEMRLYGEEPVVVWRALKALLWDNLRYLRLMLRPALFATLPMILLLIHLDRFYGRAPLPVGRAAMVTVRLRQPIDVSIPAPVLHAPPGIIVETPAVRVLSARSIQWRLRPLRNVSGRLRLVFPWGKLEKDIEAGTPRHILSARRVRSTADLLWHPGEPRLGSDAVDWVEVNYPPASLRLAGFNLHWLVIFVVTSTLSALLLKGRFGVVL